MAQQVGFTGSRLGFDDPNLVGSVVQSVVSAGHSVSVGCARGVDSLVRRFAPRAKVFKIASPGAGNGLSIAASLAQRSQFMVSSCSVLVGFASIPCPRKVSPSSHFCGGGSGTWASIAYAVAQGLQVFVFTSPGFSLPPWDGGEWLPAAPSGLWASAFTWVPFPSQLSLF